MNPNKDFNQNINQLIELLRKIISHIPNQPNDSNIISKKDKNMSINLNLCFFNMFPFSSEDLEDLEDFYEGVFSEDKDKSEDLQPNLTPSDIEFLKQNGIRF